MEKKIEEFIEKRDNCKGAYGYGSGIFKQKGYSEKDNPQLDFMFIVDNVKEWHLKNIEKNPTDYNQCGKNYFAKTSEDKLLGQTGVVYLSNILENGLTYKYGTIDYEMFRESLESWDSFFIPGRFHKPTKQFIGNQELENIIKTNQRNAVLVALLLGNRQMPFKEMFIKICQLSYYGDIRMLFAENPKKVENIVDGNYDILMEIYLELVKEYASVKNNNIDFDNDYLAIAANLPQALKTRLYDIDLNNKTKRELQIIKYLSEINRRESVSQAIQGVKTVGIVNGVNYTKAKILKRFN